MRRDYSWFLPIAAIGLLMVGSSPEVRAQKTGRAEMQSQGETAHVIEQARDKVSSLPDYGAFDWITFRLRGRTLILEGYASKPALKEEAEKAVKDVPGVGAVQNDIKVLTVSPVDEKVRMAVYDKIYKNPGMPQYNESPGSIQKATLLQASGDTANEVPAGRHPIHIIVENGHVTLYGAVDNLSDSQLIQAQVNNSIPNLTSLKDELAIGSSKAQ